MELNLNLLESKKESVFKIILGQIFIFLSIIWIILRTKQNHDFMPFEWIYFGTFVLAGIAHSAVGFGFSFERIFGKAFILIDKERIVVKIDAFQKEQNVHWCEVKSIESKPNKFTVIKTDGSSFTINFSNLEYSLVQKIKKIIHEIANQKGVELKKTI